MYQIGEIFTDDDEYSKRVDFCNQYGLIIEEIDSLNGKRQFTIKEVPPPTEKEICQREYNELKTWFDTTYAYQEQKFRRLISLNKLDDDGIDANIKLKQLYEDAERKRKRIQELEDILKEETNA